VNIKKIRERLGMSQEKFAEALSQVLFKDLPGSVGDVKYLSRQKVNDWERGRHEPDELMLLAIKALQAKRREQ